VSASPAIEPHAAGLTATLTATVADNDEQKPAEVEHRSHAMNRRGRLRTGRAELASEGSLVRNQPCPLVYCAFGAAGVPTPHPHGRCAATDQRSARSAHHLPRTSWTVRPRLADPPPRYISE
jgi:hypothetical protein